MSGTITLSQSTDFTVSPGKFVVVGDSRPNDHLEFLLEDSRRVPAIVFGAIAAEDPACVFHAGDMAVFGSRATFWQGWKSYDRDVAVLAERKIRIFPSSAITSTADTRARRSRTISPVSSTSSGGATTP